MKYQFSAKLITPRKVFAPYDFNASNETKFSILIKIFISVPFSITSDLASGRKNDVVYKEKLIPKLKIDLPPKIFVKYIMYIHSCLLVLAINVEPKLFCCFPSYIFFGEIVLGKVE